MNLKNFKHNPRFYGRRKGRKLSKSGITALESSDSYFIHENNFREFLLESENQIVLEIGFGDGDNLVNSAIKNENLLHIGADPFLNANVKCIKKLLKNNLKNVKIWPDDIRKIITYFPFNSIIAVKILFPDPWPKLKHKNRRLIQKEFINTLYNILCPNGIITIATDHKIMKSWILEIFQKNIGYVWKAETQKDWQTQPDDCFETKYQKKSLIENRIPSWFLFEKK